MGWGGSVSGMGRRGWVRVVDLGIVVVGVGVLLSGFTPTPAVEATAARAPGPSQPVYDYATAVRETVWVDTGLDEDHDGAHDRVAADIIRPQAPAGVPVIMDASPYYRCCGRGNESQVKKYADGKPTDFPLFYDNYFVPRGYAVVEVDLAGTNRSGGCTDVGGPSDVASAKAVVDWLNGRAAGYTADTGGTAVTAAWTTGVVGMIGKSWDGTIANGVAATGVDGLKTIVPISAISSWYDYYRASGATFPSSPAGLATIDEDSARQQACKTVNDAIAAGAQPDGDYDAMWAQRDYAAEAANVKASVFVAHGLNDLNVRTINFGQWWAALPATVEKKIWLSQTGHVDPFDYRRTAWVDTLHQWFDHYLLGVDNGVERTRKPTSSARRTSGRPTRRGLCRVEQRATRRRHRERQWRARPVPATRRHRDLHRQPAARRGRLDEDPGHARRRPRHLHDAAARRGRPGLRHPVDHPHGDLVPTTARLSAVLVDLGPTRTRDFTAEAEGITNLTTRSCFGDSTAADSACYLDTAADPLDTDALVFSRGWADLGHYASLSERRTLTPGTPYSITFALATTDRIVPAGHRLALVVAGTDHGVITPVDDSPKLSVDLTRSSLRLPLTGAL